jgi:hypothetical protein
MIRAWLCLALCAWVYVSLRTRGTDRAVPGPVGVLCRSVRAAWRMHRASRSEQRQAADDDASEGRASWIDRARHRLAETILGMEIDLSGDVEPAAPAAALPAWPAHWPREGDIVRVGERQWTRLHLQDPMDTEPA